jgi:hypothetical protein
MDFKAEQRRVEKVMIYFWKGGEEKQLHWKKIAPKMELVLACFTKHLKVTKQWLEQTMYCD